MIRWTLSRRLTAGIVAFSLLIALGLITITVTLSASRHATRIETDRLSPARQSAQALLTAMLDEETGLRGFALSHLSGFLDPYKQGITDETRLRAELETLIPATDPARPMLLQFDRAAATWHKGYAEPRLRALTAKKPVISASVLTNGKNLFDKVRDAAAMLDEQLASEQRMQRDHVRGLDQLETTVLILVAIVVLGGIIMLRVALERWITHPLGRLSDQIAIVSAGDAQRPIIPQGPPDLLEIGASVENMRVALVRAVADIELAGRELEDRALELERSNADLEQFAYVASHDLQEPLRKVASFCQLLEQRYRDQLDDRGVQYIDFAVDGARRMQRLINDLLLFSRVGRGGQEFAPVWLRTPVEDAWRSIASSVEDSGAMLEIYGDGFVNSDAGSLQQLMQNLLGNAVKYRRPGQPPKVIVTMKTGEDGMLHVTVADSGIGIAPEYREKVFVIFQRLHGKDEYEGTGIGLALCKKIVEYHGGEITLQDSPLGGACVAFTLPLAIRPDATPRPATSDIRTAPALEETRS